MQSRLCSCSGSKQVLLSRNVRPAILNWRFISALLAAIEWSFLAIFDEQGNSSTVGFQLARTLEEYQTVRQDWQVCHKISLDKLLMIFIILFLDVKGWNFYHIYLWSRSCISESSSFVAIILVECIDKIKTH